jgi:hypothetical protein
MVKVKVKVGKATLIEKELYVNGEYNDTVCTVKIGRSEVGV